MSATKPLTNHTCHWTPCRQVSRRRIPGHLGEWLLDPASLTTRLRRACPGGFRVQVVSQGWGRPRLDEARVLGMRPGTRGLIREVRLLCHDQPWVFARTIIPVTTLTGPQRQLAHLGNRPLGAFLFADPGMQRLPPELCRLVPGNGLFAIATGGLKSAPQEIWGRRSVFKVGGKPLLVSEIFLRDIGKLG